MTSDDELKKILTNEQLSLVKSTLKHFLQDPDYATGEEQGLSFEELSFGSPLPLEVILRDWNTQLNDGEGGRKLNEGDCYEIYKVLFEEHKLDY